MGNEVHLSGRLQVNEDSLWVSVTQSRWNKFTGKHLEVHRYTYYAFVLAADQTVQEFYGEQAKAFFALCCSGRPLASLPA